MGAKTNRLTWPPPFADGSPGGKRALWIAGIWTAAVLVSAMQIHLRELGRGTPAPWAEVLLANLLAWLPWLLAAVAAPALESRLPITGRQVLRNGVVHLACAAAFSVGFLFYLSWFHLIYLDGVALPPSAAAVRAEYLEQLGRYFMTAAALYAVLVLAGCAERLWDERRRSRGQGPAQPPGPAAGALVVRSTGRAERIDPAEVRWITAEGNYARLRLADRSVLHRRGLASLAAELADRGFARIHRSVVVNLRYVRAIERRTHGDAVLVLRDGSRLRVSRTYRKALQRLGF